METPTPESTKSFVLQKVYEFYYAHPPQVPELEKREFGFGTWDNKIEYRHMHFKGQSELAARLLNDRPPFVSYSAALYEFPDARPMPKKNWQGAELIFDLDAKHSEWDHGKKYPDCGRFTCPHCYAHIKEQAQKLMDEFLISDFGFSKNEIQLNFSGNRGYHLRIAREDVLSAGREERREIVDYIIGTGLSFSDFFSEEGKKIIGPMPSQGGYFGKFAREAIRKVEDEAFAKTLSRNFSKKEKVEQFVSGIKKGNWDTVGITHREEKFEKIFRELTGTLSAEIDANVSIDTSKLLRMPDSINGSSGMVSKRIPSLDGFEPTRDAAVFGNNPVKVKIIDKIPSLSFLNSSFGPFEPNSEISLPESVAVYLMCKRAAALPTQP